MLAIFEVHIYENEFNIRLDCNEISQATMYYCLRDRNEPYEKDVTFAVYDILKPGDVFIDVGAHIGWFTLLGAKIVGPEGRIISVEPETKNLKWLKQNIKLNNINENTYVFEVAITSEYGPVTLYLNDDNDGGHSLWSVGNHPFNEKSAENRKKVKVQGIPLDDLCRSENISEIKLLKIDTEGAEVEVLTGASQLLADGKIKNIIAEVNEFGLIQMGTTKEDMRLIMENFGYGMKIFHNDKSNCVYNVLFSKEL